MTASYFGSRSFYSCRVGADESGAFYLSDLQAAGVATNPHPAADGTAPDAGLTGRCLVLITPDAERSMNTFLGISTELSDQQIDFDALAQSRLLYIEGYLVSSPKALQAALQAKAFARAQGIEIAYTMSDTSMLQFFGDGVRQLLGDDGVDLLFCNKGEALHWSGQTDLMAAAQALKTVAKRFCITLGAQGALVFDGERYLTVAPNPVKPVDTNGAGDVFAGAFLHAYTAGHDCAAAGQLASLASAHCVTQFGPRLPGPVHAQIRSQVLG